MNGIPDTTIYFVAGYAVMLLGMAVYLVSLALRFRNLRQDEKMLEEVEKQDNALSSQPGNGTSTGMVEEFANKKE